MLACHSVPCSGTVGLQQLAALGCIKALLAPCASLWLAGAALQVHLVFRLQEGVCSILCVCKLHWCGLSLLRLPSFCNNDGQT